MRITAALLAVTLLGCQTSSSAPTAGTEPEPTRVVTRAAPEVSPPMPRRPLARLNPRRQRLQVGEAPPRHPRPRPQKVGVQVISARPEPTPRVPTRSWPPQASVSDLTQVHRAQAQVDAFMAQEQERIRQNNQILLNRPAPGGGLTPEMQSIAYPQIGPSAAHQAAEQRYLEARADFLNTKYVPNGVPPRYTPDNVRGSVGTGMPLPPTMMNQPAMFNPVLQKAQQTEMLRREMQHTP